MVRNLFIYCMLCVFYSVYFDINWLIYCGMMWEVGFVSDLLNNVLVMFGFKFVFMVCVLFFLVIWIKFVVG